MNEIRKNNLPFELLLAAMPRITNRSQREKFAKAGPGSDGGTPEWMVWSWCASSRWTTRTPDYTMTCAGARGGVARELEEGTEQGRQFDPPQLESEVTAFPRRLSRFVDVVDRIVRGTGRGGGQAAGRRRRGSGRVGAGGGGAQGGAAGRRRRGSGRVGAGAGASRVDWLTWLPTQDEDHGTWTTGLIP